MVKDKSAKQKGLMLRLLGTNDKRLMVSLVRTRQIWMEFYFNWRVFNVEATKNTATTSAKNGNLSFGIYYVPFRRFRRQR